MDDDLWEVALPSGEVKRMTLDQLDRAFQIGLIHSNTLVREGNGGDWQSLGAVAGLDEEPPTAQAATTRAEGETKRNSVLPAPPDDDPNRETLAGLGGFLNVGPAAGARGPMLKADLPSRAATLPMGAPAPAPVVVSQGNSPPPAAMPNGVARPPSLPENAFGPVASVTGPSIPPPLPANAFAPGPKLAPAPATPFIPTASVQRAPAQPVARPVQPVQAAPVQPAARPVQPVQAAPAQPIQPVAQRAQAAAPIVQPVTANPAPNAPVLGSAPPPPRHSGPPPLPPGAFAPSQPPAAPSHPPAGFAPSQPPPMPSRPPAPAATVPSVPPMNAPSPIPVVQNLGPGTGGAHLGRAPGSRAANGFIGVFAVMTLLVILHRNGVLFEVCSSLGLGGAYSSLESGVLGPPSELTPRGVEALEASAAPVGTSDVAATP